MCWTEHPLNQFQKAKQKQTKTPPKVATITFRSAQSDLQTADSSRFLLIGGLNKQELTNQPADHRYTSLTLLPTVEACLKSFCPPYGSHFVLQTQLITPCQSVLTRTCLKLKYFNANFSIFWGNLALHTTKLYYPHFVLKLLVMWFRGMHLQLFNNL